MVLHYVTLFDGVCDQTKELQTLYGSMSNDVKWIISSSGHYMFVRFDRNIIMSHDDPPSAFGLDAKLSTFLFGCLTIFKNSLRKLGSMGKKYL